MTHAFEINLPSYFSRIELLENQLVRINRTLRRKSPSVELDTYGPVWLFYDATLDSGQVCISGKDELVELAGRVGVFVPSFSILEWHLNPGEIDCDILVSSLPLSEASPSEPVVFPMSIDELFPTSVEAVEALVTSHRHHWREVGKEHRRSALARKTRTLIEANYRNLSYDIASIARQQNVAHAVMSRSFKSAYGMPPVAYRNKLRVFHGFWKLIHGHAVTETAFDVGFNDVCRFNRNFRSVYKSVPSRFRGEEIT